MLIIEDSTVTVKYRTAINALFLSFNLCLSVKLSSLSFLLHVIQMFIYFENQENNIRNVCTIELYLPLINFFFFIDFSWNSGKNSGSFFYEFEGRVAGRKTECSWSIKCLSIKGIQCDSLSSNLVI